MRFKEVDESDTSEDDDFFREIYDKPAVLEMKLGLVEKILRSREATDKRLTATLGFMPSPDALFKSHQSTFLSGNGDDRMEMYDDRMEMYWRKRQFALPQTMESLVELQPPAK